MQNFLENDFCFSELSLKAFETGKRFMVAENERFLEMALQNMKQKLIERQRLDNGEN